MESLSYSTKRKKRKTRKCLDELRMKSRRNNAFSTMQSSSATENIIKMRDTRKEILNTKSNNNHITSKRLTLAMFPKAIRSETITRPVCADNIVEAQLCTKRSKGGTSPVEPIYHDTRDTSQGDSDVIQCSDGNQNNDVGSWNGTVDRDNPVSATKLDNRRDSSVESYILFSPGEDARDVDETPNEEPSIETTTSLESSEEIYNYHLYDEFMKEVPSYLKENVPELMRDDAVKKAKTYLHNIYLESCRQECEKNILQCIKKSVSNGNMSNLNRDTIVENPMDYLRLGYAWCQDKEQLVASVGDGDDGAGAGAGAGAGGGAGGHSSSASVVSASSPRSPPSPSPPPRPRTPMMHSAISETPEYDYYPHKLNN